MAIPIRGALHWTKQYFEVGERTHCYPRYVNVKKSGNKKRVTANQNGYQCTIKTVKRNKYGRVSYTTKLEGIAEIADLLLEDFVPFEANSDIYRVRKFEA